MLPNRNSNLILISTLIASTFFACKREIINPSQAAFIATTERSGSRGSNTASAHIAASEKLIMPAAVEVPANLPGGNTRLATFYAVGVQKYKAREKAGSYPLSYEWMFVAPQADLYDVTDAKAGTHGAGPFWQISPMDSIFGQHFSPVKSAPSPDPESIDWLLLMPKTGTTPTGIFRDVAYIQRIATKGGKAPMTPPATSTETVDVKYKAVYRFIKMNP